MILERNRGEFLRSTPIAWKTNEKIKLVFHCFAHIEKNVSQLFCMRNIENISQAIEIYEKYDQKNPLRTANLHINIYIENIT